MTSFNMRLVLYMIESRNIVDLCEVPNIYMTASCVMGNIIAIGFIDGSFKILWIGNVSSPYVLNEGNFVSKENGWGESSINRIWFNNISIPIPNGTVGFQTTSEIVWIR